MSSSVLIAAFKLRPESDGRALRAIHGIVPSSIGLIAIFRRIHSFNELLAEVAGLSIELADSKISDRAAVALGHSAGERTTERVASQIVRALADAFFFEDQLRQTLLELKEQWRRRELLGRAKAKLQLEARISEEEAYLALQRISRTTSAPLAAVAERVVSGDLQVALLTVRSGKQG